MKIVRSTLWKFRKFFTPRGTFQNRGGFSESVAVSGLAKISAFKKLSKNQGAITMQLSFFTIYPPVATRTSQLFKKQFCSRAIKTSQTSNVVAVETQSRICNCKKTRLERTCRMAASRPSQLFLNLASLET